MVTFKDYSYFHSISACLRNFGIESSYFYRTYLDKDNFWSGANVRQYRFSRYLLILDFLAGPGIVRPQETTVVAGEDKDGGLNHFKLSLMYNLNTWEGWNLTLLSVDSEFNFVFTLKRRPMRKRRITRAWRSEKTG
jgi:hypothetical protein